MTDRASRAAAQWAVARPDLDLLAMETLGRLHEASILVTRERQAPLYARHGLQHGEFDVLATLASRPEMVFSRGQLIESVWGTGWIGDDHLVDVHIGHVRRKLGDDPAEPRFIRTVRGVGYRMGSGT